MSSSLEEGLGDVGVPGAAGPAVGGLLVGGAGGGADRRNLRVKADSGPCWPKAGNAKIIANAPAANNPDFVFLSVNSANPLLFPALLPEFLLSVGAARYPATPARIAAPSPIRQPAAAKPACFSFCRAVPLSQCSAFPYESGFAANHFPVTPSRYIGLLAMGSHDEAYDYQETGAGDRSSCCSGRDDGRRQIEHREKIGGTVGL